VNILKNKKTISKKDIKRLAWLSRIELLAKDEDIILEQLNQILEYFKKIDEVNTKNIEPCYHVIDLINVMRKDESKPSSDKIIEIIPQRKARYVKSPRII
jgi:aspartyl-tRNA(Asn)/glutamyl-tRNA(Gln) amidotransferase subunit C